MEERNLRTIGKAAKEIEVPTSTARQYVKDFQDTGIFSDSATPEPGKTRLFTDDDLKVLWTIKLLRAERRATQEISEKLIAGDRAFPSEETPRDASQSAQDTPGEQDQSEQTLESPEAIINALVAYEEKWADRVNDLQSQLLEAERAKGEADTRAAVAEKELEIMRSMLDNESKKRWWKFWD